MKVPAEVALAGTADADVRLPKGTLAKPGAEVTLLVLAEDTTEPRDAVRQIAALAAPKGTTLFLHPDAARPKGLLARLKPKKTIPRDVRATALLAAGYEDIGATEADGFDWVWGSR